MDGSRNRVVESRYDITLVSAGPKPQRVARIIAKFTDRTKREAMEMIETAPVLILQEASYATAEGARMALERLGAAVEVRAYEIERAARPPQSSDPPTSRHSALTTLGVLALTLFVIIMILTVVATLMEAILGEPIF